MTRRKLWLWADSRASGSKKNKFVTPILAKSRKRGLDIIYTAQSFRQIDVRIRTITDIICIPQCNDSDPPRRLAMRMYNQSMMLQKTYKLRMPFLAYVMQMYDTTEEIHQLEMKAQEKELEEAVEVVKKPMRKEPKETIVFE